MGFGFLKLDRFAATVTLSRTRFDTEYLRAADFTLVSLAKLNCHEESLLECSLFLRVPSAEPQQVVAPLPTLVTSDFAATFGAAIVF